MRGFTKTHVAGFVIAGAAIGAVAALVFAPKTGAQIRKDIRRFSRKAMNQLEDLQCDIREQLSDGYEQVRRIIRTA